MKAYRTETDIPWDGTYIAETASGLMRKVFTWMTLALSITAVISYTFANSGLISMLYSETGISPLGWIVTFCPFIMAFAIMFGLNKMKTRTLILLFIVYSVLMGMSLSFIFFVYNKSTITKTFLISAGMFAAMAIAGYTTKMDLSKFGSILILALVGIIIASIVNIFSRSGRVDWIISIFGVLIFTGLTAWDVNSLRNTSIYIDAGSASENKLAIFGALSLYLDFINLFLYILSLLGRSEN